MAKLGTIIADFRTALATKMSIGATTGTLQSATDDDGVALPAGRYFFTIDGDNSQKEHISCELNGTDLTSIKSVSRQGVETSGTVREHRVGASVVITNFAHIKYLNDMVGGDLIWDTPDLTGIKSINGLATPNSSETTKAANVDYVNNITLAGAADASTNVKGIVKLSSSPASPTEPIACGTNDPRLPTTDEKAALVGLSGTAVSVSNKLIDAASATATPTAGKIPIADGSGKLDDGWLNESVKQSISKSFVAGEDIVAGNAVIVAKGQTTTQTITQTVHNATSVIFNSPNFYGAQSFTTLNHTSKIVSAEVWINYANSPSSPTITMDLYLSDANNKPTGSSLGSVSKDWGSILYDQANTFTFSSPITLDKLTKYVLVFKASAGDWNNYAYLDGTTHNEYSGGILSTSADAGNSWSNQPTKDLYFKINLQSVSTAGNIYKADSSFSDEYATNFIGFASESVSATESCLVNIGGIDDNQTGLITGATYYLSDTPGAIATSAGSVSKKVGIAVSATEILIKHDNH